MTSEAKQEDASLLQRHEASSPDATGMNPTGTLEDANPPAGTKPATTAANEGGQEDAPMSPSLQPDSQVDAKLTELTVFFN